MTGVKYYSQYDPPQSTYPYPSKNHPTATGQTSGCGPTCFAMVNATLLNPNYTPIDAMKDSILLNDRGLEGTEDEYYSHVANKYKLSCEETKTTAVAIKALCESKLVVCHMKDWFKPGSGHFILAWGISKSKFQIHDPANRSNSAKLWDESTFIKKCIGYFIFSKPEIKKEMTTNEAVKIINQYMNDSPIATDVWTGTDNAIKGKYADALIIKFAKFLNTKAVLK
jgi:hypothetical protein